MVMDVKSGEAHLEQCFTCLELLKTVVMKFITVDLRSIFETVACRIYPPSWCSANPLNDC
jgi:hypothetical protein